MSPRTGSVSGAAVDETNVCLAFGLVLEVDATIAIPGLSFGQRRDLGTSPAYARVRLAPDELERRWSEGGPAQRMRELRHRDVVVLRVDLAGPAGYLLQAEGVGRVLISPDGTELMCDPDPRCADWAFLLPAQAIPLAATLQGKEVLHASGIVIGGSAALFAGEPGAGKSSLAASFVRNGAALLGDDAIALEQRSDEIFAHPGSRSLYLRDTERDRLSPLELELLGGAEPFAGRQRFGAAATAEATPMVALFLLERAEKGTVIEPIGDVDPFLLLATTFNLSVRTPERLMRQLDLVEALIARSCVHRLRILPGRDSTSLATEVGHYLVSSPR